MSYPIRKKPSQIEWEDMFECLEWYQENLKEFEPHARLEISSIDNLLMNLPPEIDELGWE